MGAVEEPPSKKLRTDNDDELLVPSLVEAEHLGTAGSPHEEEMLSIKGEEHVGKGKVHHISARDPTAAFDPVLSCTPARLCHPRVVQASPEMDRHQGATPPSPRTVLRAALAGATGRSCREHGDRG